jgi:hypothetical protein
VKDNHLFGDPQAAGQLFVDPQMSDHQDNRRRHQDRFVLRVMKAA